MYLENRNSEPPDLEGLEDNKGFIIQVKRKNEHDQSQIISSV
jgi:hypothetical protein